MVRDAIQQTGDVNDNIKDQTEELNRIIGMHKLIGEETQKGKSIIKTLKSRAFWDRYLYKLVFVLYLAVVTYVITKHVGNLAFRIYDWSCWIPSFFISWLPGFDYVCPGYSWSSTQTVQLTPEEEEDMFAMDEDVLFKPEL